MMLLIKTIPATIAVTPSTAQPIGFQIFAHPSELDAEIYPPTTSEIASVPLLSTIFTGLFSQYANILLLIRPVTFVVTYTSALIKRPIVGS